MPFTTIPGFMYHIWCYPDLSSNYRAFDAHMKKLQASIIREPERPLQALCDKSESLKSSKVPPNRSAERPIPHSRSASMKEDGLRQFPWQSSQPLFSNHCTEHILYLQICRQSISVPPNSRSDKLPAFTILRVFTSQPDRQTQPAPPLVHNSMVCWSCRASGNMQFLSQPLMMHSTLTSSCSTFAQ